LGSWGGVDHCEECHEEEGCWKYDEGLLSGGRDLFMSIAEEGLMMKN